MKVHELFGAQSDNARLYSEQELVNALQLHDWMAEFSDNDFRINSAAKNLDRLEESVYQVWKVNPDAAIKLWKRYTPYGNYMSEGVTPGFIIDRQHKDVK